MKKLDLLKKIIREEVKAAIREELPKILKENKATNSDYRKNIQEQVQKNSAFPLTLNEPSSKKPVVKFDSTNPLGRLLNETAISMTTDDVSSFNNSKFGGGIIGSQNHENASAGSVNDMINSARKSSVPEMVQIDTVPDFTGMMEKLKSKGLL